MSKPARSPQTPEQVVADALNEQGFLLQHKIVDILRSGDNGKSRHNWHIEASEVPVSLPNGDETRIDLVLCQSGVTRRPWRVLIECKRSTRDFKRWVFFGETTWPRGPSPDNYYVEQAHLSGSWNNQGEPPMTHAVSRCQASRECSVFEFGVEAKINLSGHEKRSSATTAIEDAFQQVTLGQAGLAHKLRAAHELNFTLLPIVVTTAELLSAHFSINRVSRDGGTIESKDLSLAPRSWLAVNYRMSEVACELSGVTTNRTADLAADLVARQVRTVFVTQATHVQQFLAWLENWLDNVMLMG